MTPTPRYSSRAVSNLSHALDLQRVEFTWEDPLPIARSLQHSADSGSRRRREAYASAMAMQERGKVELRRLKGRS